MVKSIVVSEPREYRDGKGSGEQVKCRFLSTFLLVSVLATSGLMSGCGADSFLRNAARVHSYTKGARQVLENIYDDKLASRETVLEIARPLQRFQAKQVEVFEIWKRCRDASTGECKLSVELAAEIAAILVALRSDFAALKQKADSPALPSPATAMLAPALKALEGAYNDFAAYLGSLNGVSRRGGILRLLRAQQDQAERIYAEMLRENQEVAAWIN
jgi:hypothetical protein